MGLTSLVKTDGVFLEGLSNPLLIWRRRKKNEQWPFQASKCIFIPNPPKTPKFHFPHKQKKVQAPKVVVFFPNPFPPPPKIVQQKSSIAEIGGFEDTKKNRQEQNQVDLVEAARWKSPNHPRWAGWSYLGGWYLLLWCFRNPVNSPVDMENLPLFTGFPYMEGWLFGISCRMVLVISTFGLNTTPKDFT